MGLLNKNKNNFNFINSGFNLRPFGSYCCYWDESVQKIEFYEES